MRYTAQKILPMPKFAAGRHGPPPALRARAAPTESHARIVVIYPIKCDHIYVNRIISHKVIVSECITLKTLHRRFRPGTSCVGLILKTYSHQKKCGDFEIKLKIILVWDGLTSGSTHYPAVCPSSTIRQQSITTITLARAGFTGKI